VPWAKAGIGAVVTQAFANANVAYGPDGLTHLEAGLGASVTLATLLDGDDLRSHSQAR